MKRAGIIALVVLMCIVLGGTAMASGLASAHDVMVRCGLTAQDCDEVTLAEIIRRLSLTDEDMEAMSAEELTSRIRATLASNYMDNYTYLMNSPEPRPIPYPLDVEKVTMVCVYRVNITMKETLLIDVQNGVCYVGDRMDFLNDIQQAKQTKELTQDGRELMNAILQHFDCSKWQAAYDGDNAGMQDIRSYGIAIETTDGIYRSTVYGNVEDVPEELGEIVMLFIRNFAWESD